MSCTTRRTFHYARHDVLCKRLRIFSLEQKFFVFVSLLNFSFLNSSFSWARPFKSSARSASTANFFWSGQSTFYTFLMRISISHFSFVLLVRYVADGKIFCDLKNNFEFSNFDSLFCQKYADNNEKYGRFTKKYTNLEKYLATAYFLFWQLNIQKRGSQTYSVTVGQPMSPHS